MRDPLEWWKRAADMSGKVIVITGGAGVLGRDMAQFLMALGAHVIALGRSEQKGQALISSLQQEEATGTIDALACDVTSLGRLQEVCEQIWVRHQRIDGLINAAGGNQPGATTQPEQSFFQLSADAVRQVTDVNWMGTFLPCQVFGQKMAEQGRGVILNIASMASLKPLTRIPAYSASKAAIVNFTQWLAVHMAQEYSPDIRVNALAPGFFLTEQNRFLLLDQETGEPTERGQSIISHTPMDRYGAPQDLLGCVHWLMSDLSAFVTGIVVPVDGGFDAFGGV